MNENEIEKEISALIIQGLIECACKPCKRRMKEFILTVENNTLKQMLKRQSNDG